MANVRFYRLETLPNFDVSKHVGVFVHLIPNNSESHKSGLWFGGATDWEYLTNDTDTIDAAIDAKIQELDVTGYAQATMTINEPLGGENSSTLTISGIKEVDGEIAKDDDQKLEVAIDGKYDKEVNKIATQSTINNKIGTLDANAFQTVTKSTSGVNTVLTFNGIKEVDGIISQGVTENAETLTVGDAKLKIQIGSSTASDVFSANAQADSTIKLDGLVFKKNGDVISVITPTALASDNRLVTEKDVASLAGAMHYKGTVSSLDDFNKIINNTDSDSDAEEAGNVYIATGTFTHGNNDISTGDMIVFNGASNYNVIQSNITLGTGSGQIAANSAALSKDKIVVASENGIETIDFDGTNLTSTENGNNTRTLGIANGTIADGDFHHAVTITDTFKVIGKDFSKSIDIKSNNRSIDIAQNGNNGVVVDLVWNTTIE